MHGSTLNTPSVSLIKAEMTLYKASNIESIRKLKKKTQILIFDIAVCTDIIFSLVIGDCLALTMSTIKKKLKQN